MKRTLNGIEVNVRYYGDKNVDFHFESPEDALSLIELSLKEGYTITITNKYRFDEEEAG